MKMKFVFIGLLSLCSFSFCNYVSSASADDSTSNDKDKKGKNKKDKDKKNSAAEVSIVAKWDLPDELKEVSGIAYLDDNRFACVQDERGIIFIYNRGTKSIEKQIPFRGPGDYEAIAVNGNTAYVATADGELFEANIMGANSAVKKHKTGLTAAHDVEGLCYDRKNNRLLIACKNDEPGNKDYKAIYAFDLASNSFVASPVYKIRKDDPELKNSGGRKDAIMPSEIGIHPLTNELYITDGPNARLLILNSDGKVNRLLNLGKSFAQPEGIAFSPDGEIFISNEGSKRAGNIMQVEVR
jgi:uncharacterized protein YjiK